MTVKKIVVINNIVYQKIDHDLIMFIEFLMHKERLKCANIIENVE